MYTRCSKLIPSTINSQYYTVCEKTDISVLVTMTTKLNDNTLLNENPILINNKHGIDPIPVKWKPKAINESGWVGHKCNKVIQ